MPLLGKGERLRHFAPALARRPEKFAVGAQARCALRRLIAKLDLAARAWLPELSCQLDWQTRCRGCGAEVAPGASCRARAAPAPAAMPTRPARDEVPRAPSSWTV
eukprot:scaffold130053_cov54-Phaeocystis_antarctica.AAC.2